MRLAPDAFEQRLGIQWLCAAMDQILGLRYLAEAPVLLSGFGSITDSAAAKAFATAAFNLRQLGVELTTESALRYAINAALEYERERGGSPEYVEPPYALDADAKNMPFRLRSGHVATVRAMLAALTSPLPMRTTNIAQASTAHPMAAITGIGRDEKRFPVDLTSLPPIAQAQKHDLARMPRGKIVIPVAELVKIAEEMDALDKGAPERQAGNWKGRLLNPDGTFKFDILGREAGALAPQSEIVLDGVKHMIGLPGTGKTTLIVLILVWLSKKGYKAVVLLPSIEICLNFLADLRFYGANVGLLMGQSPRTRNEHAAKLAERIASQDDAGGFGRSAPGADLMAQGCAVAGFIEEDPEGDLIFPHLSPPCRDFRQRNIKSNGTLGGQEGPRLCPLSSRCGRLKAARELPFRSVWLGHILSTDTSISPHFSGVRIRYFEEIAKTADLVIVDEADGAQAVLDDRSIAKLALTGSEESYDHILNRDLFMPVTAGRNDYTSNSVISYSHEALDFRKMNSAVTNVLHEQLKLVGNDGPLMKFKDMLITSSVILSSLFGVADFDSLPEEQQIAEDMKHLRLRDFWDACIRLAISERTDIEDPMIDPEYQADVIAQALGCSIEQLDETAGIVVAGCRSWVAENSPSRQQLAMQRMCDAMFKLIPPRIDETTSLADATRIFQFLVTVTAVVIQFVRLVPMQQAMVSEGIHDSSIFDDGVSADLMRMIPENLVGRLSGIRFQVQGEGSGARSIQLQYVAFRGAPRVLLYRLHELLRHDGGQRGPAVLLASATSYLLESPTYHIPVGPDYVLRRPGASDGWKESEFIFSPIADRRKAGSYLKFSGAPLQSRDQILNMMVDHYFDGEKSLASAMLEDFDAGRKVAFVVNSYDQVRRIKARLAQSHPKISHRVIGVINRIPRGSEGDWVTASQVERLGMRNDWDFIVFPMKSIARGVNVVFEKGSRVKDALIGTIVFLTRPHPSVESLGLAAGLASRATMRFDQRVFRNKATIADMTKEWRTERNMLLDQLKRLLRFPLQASRLGPLGEPFTADIMVDVLQTIGRGMRNGCKVRVIFSDAAWAPRSALGQTDGTRTSMIVIMRDILQTRLADPDPIAREIYRALYEPFLRPLEACGNVKFPA
jgi:hypothetical protein